ncbi:PREDICTED: probable glycosyltransferase At3g07620 [Nelumbo nucifera]|uniref:Probable glycosyltransferase At3g07620 n=1 Tax=Nelumbo nucifera TaxID=4432 RepID=A0A1U7ZXW6_NELNU|nr:PREDICTED: probable glycosyltransferase At3g07620 [Nelumbo nucifera]XP_010254016.1 PREDICTED: probable glycosyltransferase At3g07620 [Nelumbo nucifera]XP_010254017.1 PREDICTED: probable glycosyltransferase At3g07620 [Nelumbo nucifera]
MEYVLQFQKLCQFETRRLLFVLGIATIIILLLQSLMLPYGNALLSKSLVSKLTKFGKSNSPPKSVKVDNFLLVNTSNSTGSFETLEMVKNTNLSNVIEETEHDNETNVEAIDREDDFVLEDRGPDNDFELDEGIEPDNESLFEEVINKNSTLDDFKDPHTDPLLDKSRESQQNLTHKQIITPDTDFLFGSRQKPDTGLTREKTESPDTHAASSLLTLSPVSSTSITHLSNLGISSNESIISLTFQSNKTNDDPARKKMKCEMPPTSVTSIAEMNNLLIRSRASPRSLKPRWSSVHDQELLSAKEQIQNAPVVRNDRELYAPLFRNVSMFKRSYELMEGMLKVYVYREGRKPIFHQPILKGIYASEGWFMKLMEGNRHFSVKDPKKAHLFYMPFSTRMLEYTLYVHNSHNRMNLRQYLKSYVDMIAAKYPFWNRTGGADHFLVACHDWAPYETRHHMERCIKALCNADVAGGFKIGRDVSLPETYVRFARNPLRDVGGKPPSERTILAFFAGNMHGYLRPILLQYWEKDPDMKIFGPLPHGVARKMNYIQHMKSSKYCICAKGYEVNSPRIVEAIFYECVPVIISDNFIPPFFEVLDWDAFSVILPEKDIPNLKDILRSIPEEKYLAMQLGVRKVQKHFLWHSKPMKYDLFYMTLHSIWFNRVFQLKPR